MSRTIKIIFAAILLIATIAVSCILIVTPQKAMSVAVMKNCISAVRLSNVEILSIAAIEDLSGDVQRESPDRLTKSLVESGRIKISYPQVLIKYERSGIQGRALCNYSATYWVQDGRYSFVSLLSAQNEYRELSKVELVMWKSFSVGLVDRVLSLIPVSAEERRYLID